MNNSFPVPNRHEQHPRLPHLRMLELQLWATVCTCERHIVSYCCQADNLLSVMKKNLDGAGMSSLPFFQCQRYLKRTKLNYFYKVTVLYLSTDP